MLPNLPKKNKHKEASDGLDFRSWFSRNYHKFEDCDFELKDSRGKDNIAYSEITQEQIDSALRTQSDKGNLVRIVNGTPGAPDYTYHRRATAYFVITYPKITHLITINNFLHEKEHSKRKSLTEERASAIATISVKL